MVRPDILLLSCFLLVQGANKGGLQERKRKGKVCRGADKTVYKEGEGYAEGCVTYTCTKLGKKMMSLVPSVVGACCEVKARGLFPAGQVIHDTGPASCPRVRLSCELTPHDRPQVREQVLPGACCYHRGASLAPGARVPMASKCSWLVCRQEEESAWLEVEAELEGCHCCLEGGRMVGEGARSQDSRGRAIICYRGSWVSPAEPVQAVEVVEVVEAGGQRLTWNSSIGVLTLEPLESGQEDASRVFFLPSQGLRVVRGADRCLVSKLQEPLEPEQLLEDFEAWQEDGLPGEEHHLLQVTVPASQQLARSPVVMAACTGALVEEARDVPVTAQLFLSVMEGRLLSLARREGSTAGCQVNSSLTITLHMCFSQLYCCLKYLFFLHGS